MLFSVLFCVCLITANVLETKQISFGPISITGGLLVFPVSYIINDCVCEVWGYRKARLLIWLGFLMNFIFVAFGALCDAIPGAPYWQNEEGFHAVFGLAPRIAAGRGAPARRPSGCGCGTPDWWWRRSAAIHPGQAPVL